MAAKDYGECRQQSPNLSARKRIQATKLPKFIWGHKTRKKNIFIPKDRHVKYFTNILLILFIYLFKRNTQTIVLKNASFPGNTENKPMKYFGMDYRDTKLRMISYSNTTNISNAFQIYFARWCCLPLRYLK